MRYAMRVVFDVHKSDAYAERLKLDFFIGQPFCKKSNAAEIFIGHTDAQHHSKLVACVSESLIRRDGYILLSDCISL